MNRDLPSRRGAALLIVLAFLVILAGIVVAYLSRTTTDRHLAHATSNEIRADVLARSALDVIVGDIKLEILTGSSPTPAPPAPPIYLPASAANMIPRRSGVPTGLPEPLPNLIRRSVSPDTILAPGVPSRASAVNSTTDISANGRSVTLARWNKHYLLPRYNTGVTIDYTPPSPLPSPFNPNPPVATGFIPPDWVLVSRAGPAPKTEIGSGISAINNPDPLNSNFVIGRYAYTMYDEGGLIDANVAGFPTGTTTAQSGRKGFLTFADLTQTASIPQTQIDRLVGWRNSATAQATPSPTVGAFPVWTFDAASATRYFDSIVSNTSGFLTVSSVTWPSGPTGRTDQAFVNRQQLLKFRTDTGFTQNALQYLGTFSRELNRPSWSPTLNATDMGAANNGTGNVYAYKDNALSSTAINRNLNTVLVTTGFTRFNGNPAQSGEPLLSARFPLTRLSWLTYKGPSADVYAANNNDPVILALLAANVSLQAIQAGTKASIKACFGLVWDSRPYQSSPRQGQQWVYDSPTTTNSGGDFDPISNPTGSAAIVIKTLNTIQSEAREPDFFEILKATILNGSVGLGSNNVANTFVVANPSYYDTTNGKSTDYQLLQIGANMMDVWDTDNIPTWINFNGNEAAGIENLPYVNKLIFMPSFASGGGDFFDAWLVPSLWNPHQNAPGTGTIRVALNGSAQLSGTGVAKQGSTTTTTTAGPISPLPATMDINAAGFASPAPQTTTPLSRTASVTQVTDPSLPYWGFHFPFTATTQNATAVTKQDADSAYPDFGAISSASSLEIQVRLPGTTTFVPYQTWNIAATGHPLVCQGAKNNFGSNNKLQDPEFVSLDPRTVRFGIWGSTAIGQTGARSAKDYIQGENDSLDEQNPAKRFEQINLYAPQPNTPSTAPFKVSGFPSTLYLYCTNDQASDFYKDIDGVQRFADYATNNGITQGSTIMYGTNSADRVRIPSAPLQSVAELGQVFRDQPWKTINFTNASPNATSRSGDAALLDVFTVQDVAMTAGKASLNTRQISALNAIISKATKAVSGATALTGSTVTNISSALIGLTSANPMMNKAEIVTRLASDGSVTGLGNKEAREAVVRALSDATQTRTWNLMIDVIAQSGRYPPTANGLADFIVEGEKRYWLHVAIDRFTGEVIDQQLEAVYE